MDIGLLSDIGLQSKEIAVYLQLIKRGPQTVQEISRSTGLNRSSVYRFVETLVQNDLAEWVISPQGKRAQARPLESLNELVNRKKRVLKSIENGLPALISDLNAQKVEEKAKTQVRYFEGKEGVQQMVWNTLRAEEVTRSYAPFLRRKYIDVDFENDFEKEWVKRGLHDKVIANETRSEYIQSMLVPEYRKELSLRIIPKSKYPISSEICIYNDVFSVISFEGESPIGVEIENSNIALNQIALFDLVWGIAEPYSKT